MTDPVLSSKWKADARVLKNKVLCYYSWIPPLGSGHGMALDYAIIAGAMCLWPGCTVRDLDLLTIDHVNGGGRAHRKALGLNGGSRKFYQYLVREGYPPGYQTLCANHNLLKALKEEK